MKNKDVALQYYKCKTNILLAISNYFIYSYSIMSCLIQDSAQSDRTHTNNVSYVVFDKEVFNLFHMITSKNVIYHKNDIFVILHKPPIRILNTT